MSHPLHPVRRWLAAIMAAALWCGAGSTRADAFEEDSTKAGFILNFIKYVEWPAAALPAAI